MDLARDYVLGIELFIDGQGKLRRETECHWIKGFWS